VGFAYEIRRKIMAGISRVNGGVVAGTLTGGYQMAFLKVTDSGSGFTADTGGSGTAITEGGFQKAIRNIQTVASIVYIGTRANGQFVIAVDEGSAGRTGQAYNSDATPTVAERIKLELDATALFGTVAVTDITGLAAGVLA
jgi:uncharacterized protein (DUF697 family)